MRAVLVTGGAGYIGSHVCKRLAAAGFCPVTYDNLSRGNAWAVKWGPIEEGDIADRRRLDAVFERWRPVGVLHFAAYAYVGESVADPLLYYANNVAGSLALVAAMRSHGVNRLVFSSSCATYGIPGTLPIEEEHPQAPITPYGASKLMVERILHDAGTAYGLRPVVLRYFNAAGADSDGEIGEHHAPETHAVPLAILAALGRGPAFRLFGTDYPTPDGTAVRDYIHVEDLADAHVLAFERLLAGGDGGTFNLGTGTGTSVRQLLDAVGRVAGRAVPVVEAPRRTGDPPVLVARAERARRELGWTPRHTDIANIVRSAWRWSTEGVATLREEACPA